MSKSDSSNENAWNPGFTRWFFAYRAVFYLMVAFLVRESIGPGRSETATRRSANGVEFIAMKSDRKFPSPQGEASSDFSTWSESFASRLDRAMATGVAE